MFWQLSHVDFLINRMRNKNGKPLCIYFFYSIPVNKACGASLVWFPIKVDERLSLWLSGHHLLNCCWQHSFPCRGCASLWQQWHSRHSYPVIQRFIVLDLPGMHTFCFAGTTRAWLSCAQTSGRESSCSGHGADWGSSLVRTGYSSFCLLLKLFPITLLCTVV